MTGRSGIIAGKPTPGFTLIELLVVMSIIGLLLTLAVPRYFHTLQRSRETILKHDLAVLRDGIDKYYGDLGKLPEGLPDLAAKNYIRAVPVDPITRSSESWITEASEDPDHPGVRDVHSGSAAKAADGSLFNTW